MQYKTVSRLCVHCSAVISEPRFPCRLTLLSPQERRLRAGTDREAAAAAALLTRWVQCGAPCTPRPGRPVMSNVPHYIRYVVSRSSLVAAIKLRPVHRAARRNYVQYSERSTPAAVWYIGYGYILARVVTRMLHTVYKVHHIVGAVHSVYSGRCGNGGLDSAEFAHGEPKQLCH